MTKLHHHHVGRGIGASSKFQKITSSHALAFLRMSHTYAPAPAPSTAPAPAPAPANAQATTPTPALGTAQAISHTTAPTPPKNGQ
ncbi:hypothetical protein O181_007953 [Austropuccinia psidii MF-1]|uniref:Uncharacterized protein n=1 Tax=Austropuccinia psidii MF-1 TaxID=1389203 RepID=A0A9Q3BNH1_9BASI|nr:hypothetical protein [Austropuccinia psidii MF-1]